MTAPAHRQLATSVGPAEPTTWLREYVAIGCSAFMVEMPAPFDFETLERLIGEVKPLVDGTA